MNLSFGSRPRPLARVAVVATIAVAMIGALLTVGVRQVDAIPFTGNDYVPGTIAGGVPTPNSALSASDCALVIQMSGSFADGLGTYEILDPATVAPTRTYGNGQVVQYVVLPGGCAQTREVTATYDVPDWNGTTGGVVFLGGTTLTLSADIDASGAGYRSVDDGLTGAGCDGVDGIAANEFGIAGMPGGSGAGGIIGGGGGAAGHAGSYSAQDNSEFISTGGGGGTTSAGGAGGESDINGGVINGDGFFNKFEGAGGAANCVGQGGDAIGSAADGNQAPQAPATNNFYRAVGGGGGGGSSYGAGGGACSSRWSASYSSGGGGGGSWTGGGAGGAGGGNFGLTGPPIPTTPNPNGAAGNAPEPGAIPDANHYLNDADPRLVLGGAGGDSFTGGAGGSQPGGAGGGIVVVAFNAVQGGSSQLLANGNPGSTPDNLGHGSSGSGGGAGGQIAVISPTVTSLNIAANGAPGGPAVSDAAAVVTQQHTGSSGASGGAGGIWFKGASPTPGTNTGGANAASGDDTLGSGLTDVQWEVLGGSAAVVNQGIFTVAGVTYTRNEWLTVYNAAGAASIANQTPLSEELALQTGAPAAELEALFPGLNSPDNPKNTGFGCQPGLGGAGLVSVTPPEIYDLALVKVLTGTAPDEVGEIATYSIVVRNQGDLPASFEVTDTIAAGLTYVANSATVGTDPTTGVEIAIDDSAATTDPAAPGSLVWTLGTTNRLEAGEEVTLTFQATLNDVRLGTYRNDAEISADDGNDIDSFPDTNVANDSDNDTDTTNDADDTRDYTGVADVANTDVNTDDEDDHDPAVFQVVRPLRLGNLVWEDVNNNGLVDDNEPALEGVTVQLWTDLGGDGVFTPGVDDVGIPLTAVTDAAGNYWFDDLDPAATYFVAIPDGQPVLDGFVSSTGLGENTAENDIDNVDDGDGTLTGYASVSGPIGLAIDGEPANEGDENTNATLDGTAETYINDPSRSGPQFDVDSNLTVDLGLYMPFDLALAKTINTVSDPLVPSGTISFDITVTNQGADVQTIEVTDYIDVAEFETFATADNPNGTVGSFNYAWSGDGTATPTVTITAADAASVLAEGDSVVVPITLTVATTWDGSPLENWAEISRFDNNLTPADGDSAQAGTGAQLVDVDSTPDAIDGSDGSQGPGEDPLQNHVDDDIDGDATQGGDEDDHDVARYTPEYDLALAKVIASISADGQQVTYEIVIRNQGDAYAGAFDVTDEIAAGTSFVSANNGGTEAAGIVTWEIPATTLVGPDEELTLTLIVQIDDPTQAPFVNTAEISDSATDDDSTPDTTLTGAGSDPLVDITDVTDLATDTNTNNPDEDDHDIAVLDVPLYRLGNLVWFDVNDDGTADPTEPGIGNVDVQLWAAGGTAPLQTQTTGTDGSYSFDNLPAGDYFIVIPDGQTGQTIGTETVNLDDFFGSSTSVADPDAAGDADNDNNGVENAGAHQSGIVSIGEGSQFNPSEPIDEVNRVDGSDDDDDAFPDNQSNYEVDFGFVQPLRVGNLVWLDNGGGFGNAGYDVTNDDNGQADPGEAGVPGVLVQLLDSVGDVVAETVTDANGNYLFDGLMPGNYQIGIPEDQTPVLDLTLVPVPAALAGLQSSTATSTDVETSDDDDDGAPATNYASLSATFALNHGQEAEDEQGDFEDLTNDGAENAANTATSFVFDNNSNLEVDFGFTETPLYRLGNLIWEDYDNDGVADAGEPGVPGVLVQLLDANGVVVAETVTDVNGEYLFADLDPGEYRINLPADQTPDLTDPQPDIVPGALNGLTPSGTPVIDPDAPGVGDVDNDQNGFFENGTPGDDITTGLIELGEGNTREEPTGETDRNGGSDEDPAVSDDRSNLTLDIGLFRGLRLGNQVWLDGMQFGGAGNTPGFDNGVFDVDEVGIGGVTVELFIDVGPAGFDTGDTPAGTTVTDAEGNYLFEGLDPNVPYIVAIQSIPGTGVVSSSGQSATPGAADNDDDGAPAPAAGYLAASGPITLTLGGTSTDEADTVPVGEAGAGAAETEANGQSNIYPDGNSELEVDFGFIEVPLYRLGNLIWEDYDNNGQAESDEPGIPGILVQLIDANGDVIAETATDGDGKYVFENLSAGDYSVRIPSTQQAEGADPAGFIPGALDGLVSSSVEEANADGNVDNDDNGIVVPQGWESGAVTLGGDPNTNGTEPENEVDRIGGPDDDPNDGADSYPDDQSNLSVDFGFYRLSLGDTVWADTNDNGSIDPGEDGIADVSVELYEVQPNGDLVLVDSTTTDGDGNYLFTGLTDGTEYVVRIPASEFGPGEPLEDLFSSTDPAGGAVDPDGNEATPGSGTDSDDNGVDPANQGDPVDSLPILLNVQDEPTGEDPTNPEPGADRNDNLTVDFGFHPGLRIGSLVWLDDGNLTGTDENGIADPTEAGIDDVTVELYLDNGTIPGVLDPGDTFVESVETANGGLYEFGGLGEGNYLVQIPEDQFAVGAPLAGTTATTTTTATDVNNDNDGSRIDGQGMVSSVVELTFGGEPDDEANTGTSGDPDEDGNYGDANSNLSIDFGVIDEPLYRIGNLVWNDVNHDGQAGDAADEPGIPGVTVQLLDENNVLLFETTTDPNGNYSFENLEAGNYRVFIPSNGIPDRFTSSSIGQEDEANNDGDNNDNGVGTGGWVSSVVVLGNPEGEPTNEETRVGSGVDDDTGTPADTPDDRSNYSVDFGFYELSLGNQVFLDWDNSGERDGVNEVGVPDVAITLIDASDGSVVATTTTDPEGLYLFEGLVDGTEYIVQIDATNFAPGGPLDGYHSSDGSLVGGDPDGDPTDQDDNGAPVNPAVTNGAVQSQPILMEVGQEPTDETGPDNDDVTPNANENLTVDFGFYTLTVGNTVWFDNNNNGALDPGEVGIADVAVTLIDPADGSILGTTTTDPNGLYLFTGLPEGDYVVQIDPSNFAPGGPLDGLNSSPPESDPDDVMSDDDDNGINGPTVQSPTFSLSAGDAPPATGDASNADPDVPLSNQNLNVDFGFHGMSLGNLVWLDIDGDGVVDPVTEPGRPEVPVQLWASNDAGELLGGAPLATDVTDEQGHYLFPGLAAGTYVVVVPEEAFEQGGALFGYTSTFGNGLDAPDPDDTTLDSDDNGDPHPDGYAVTKPVTLVPGGEPLNETDVSANPAHVDNANDANSNLTVDLGFEPRPGLSLGNKVWHDYNNDGLDTPGEPGVDGVRVELYDDQGQLVAFDITQNGGYYLFVGLDEGDYTVVIPAENFDEPTDPLWGYHAPADPAGLPTDPDDNVDLDDDGVAPASPFGDVTSLPVSLRDLDEPLNETDIEPPGLRVPNDPNENLTVDFAFVQVALGGTLFADPGEDGSQDPTDEIFPSVTVSLLDETGEPVLDGQGNPITTTTNDNGDYLFTGLAPGTYIVEIPESAFEPGGPLAGQASTRGTGGTAPDPDDDIDLVDDGDPVSGDVFVRGPVRSKPVDLAPDTEPELEASAATSGLPDKNENLTVDFGFFEIPPVELGGIIWIDTNNNGTVDPDEQVAPAGAVLNLLDENGDPILDGGGNPITTTTGDDGSYLFQGLMPGTYIVEIDASNIVPGGPLENLLPSTGPGVSSDPNDDAVNVSDGYGQPGGAIRSLPVTVSIEAEPTNDPDPAGSPNSSSNRTVDFGLYQVEIAGFVWIDANNDGVVDPSETVGEGVVVDLVTVDGTPVLGPLGEPLTTTTNSDGEYEFVGVPVGEYRASLNASNFEPGGPLNDLIGSIAEDNEGFQPDGSFWSVPFNVVPGVNAPGTRIIAVELGLVGRPVVNAGGPTLGGPTPSAPAVPAAENTPTPAPFPLALTGGDARLGALLGLLLVVSGAALVTGTRRVRKNGWYRN